jgi:hypothetical protein
VIRPIWTNVAQSLGAKSGPKDSLLRNGSKITFSQVIIVTRLHFSLP